MRKIKLINLILIGILIVSLSSCYYKLKEDKNPTGPGGTGVQGYKLMLRIIPDVVPANGTSAVVVEVVLMDMEYQTPVAGQDVYLRIFDKVGGEYYAFDPYMAHFENGTTNLLATTAEDGTIHVPIYIGDSFGKVEGEWLAYVKAEATLEFDTPEQYVADIDSFLIYNPYF